MSRQSGAHDAVSQEDVDLAMAIAMQEEENRRGARINTQQQQQQRETTYGGQAIPVGNGFHPNHFLYNGYAPAPQAVPVAYGTPAVGGGGRGGVGPQFAYISSPSGSGSNQHMDDHAMAYAIQMQEMQQQQQLQQQLQQHQQLGAQMRQSDGGGLISTDAYRATEAPGNAQGGSNAVMWLKRGILFIVSIVLIILFYQYMSKQK